MMRLKTRFTIDRFTAASLRGSRLERAAERELGVYLPPGYDDDTGRRYPVIYFLHGYGLDGRHLTIQPRGDLVRHLFFPLRLLGARLLRRTLCLEDLDELILRRELPPFILVQPDGSLPLPHKYRARRLDGSVTAKGSLYTDSPYTGGYQTFTFEEVVRRIDARYRTIADRSGRSLMGGSMGGYGALRGGILYPHLFQAVVALSPSINCLELLDTVLIAPYHRLLLGERKAMERGRKDLDDILETCDLVFSADRPLLPTVRRAADGTITSMDPPARERWLEADLGRLVERVPGAFRDVRLVINCERSDEYGFAAQARRFHLALERLGIPHEFEIYSDPLAARYSPHTFGIAWHILPGIRYCLG